MFLPKYLLQSGLVGIATIILVGQIFSQTLIVPDSTIRWDYLNSDTVRSIKTVFAYDDHYRVTEEIEQRWNLSEDSWEIESRMVSQYNAFALDTLTQYKHDGTWLPSDREIHTYQDGRRTSITNQEWDAITSNWINLARSDFSRSEGQVSISNKVWDHDQQNWSHSDSTITVLNDLGVAASDTGYIWLALGGIYIYNQLTLYHYNSLNQLTERLRHRYEPDSNRFLLRSRDTFAYNHQGFRLLSQFDVWSRTQQQWSTSFRIERTPNAEGLLEESKLYFPDFFTDELALNSRLIYTYTDGGAAQGSDTLVATVKNLVFQGGIEVPDWIVGYFYPELTTAHKQIISSNPRLTVYPNPARNRVWLDGNTEHVHTFTWINNDGKVVDRGQYDHSIPVPQKSAESLLLVLSDQWGQIIQVRRVLQH